MCNIPHARPGGPRGITDQFPLDRKNPVEDTNNGATSTLEARVAAARAATATAGGTNTAASDSVQTAMMSGTGDAAPAAAAVADADGCMTSWLDGRTDGRTDRRTDGRTDGWIMHRFGWMGQGVEEPQ